MRTENVKSLPPPMQSWRLERGALENPTGHLIVPIPETPLVWSIPVRRRVKYGRWISFKPEFTALLLTLVLFYGGTLAEIVRAGIQSVPRGNRKRPGRLGFKKANDCSSSFCPRRCGSSFRRASASFSVWPRIPALGIAIGFPDMYSVSFTTMNQSGRTLQLFVLMMLVYMLISLVFSLVANWYNERIKLVER